MTNGLASIVEHGAWSLDVQLQMLRVNGKTVLLQPGVLKLLLFLVHREGQLISKAELVDAVWNGRVVSDAAIYNRVKALRSALADDVGPERCIHWEYGRGLRFARPVTVAATKSTVSDPAVEQAQALQWSRSASDQSSRFAGGAGIEELRPLLGTYNLYFRTPSWPDATKIAVSMLSEHEGRVVVETIEKGQDHSSGISQDAQYLGHAELIDGRVYVFEQNQQPPRGICLTVLDAPHAFRPDVMTGMMMGSSWRLRGAPYATRVIWRRVPSDKSLIDAIRHSGPVADVADLDDMIREGIGLHCLTFDRSFTVAQNEVDRSAPATAVPSLRQAALDGPCTVAISRFQIMSNDVAFKDLAQGLLADIAAQISRFREVRFIASNPAISAASDPASIISSADEAGAHYVIGGTLRSSANKVRLTTNVIDTRSETQIWANGYELPISRMYMGQDEFTRSITTSVVTALRDDQLAIANLKEIDALSAWECYLRGSSIMHTFDPEAQAEAIAIFERGIRLDPGLADLHAALSYSKITQSRILRNLQEAMALGHQRTSSRVIAFDLAKKALQMDPRVPLAWLSLGRSHLCLGEFESAILALERALELNPNFGWVHYMLGFCYWPLNRASEALAALDMARDTLMEERCQWTVIAGRACALMAAGRFEEAIQAATRAQIDPRADQFAFCPEICSLSHLGRRAEAKQALQKAQKKLPNFGLALIESDQPLPDPEIRKMIADGLNLAERGPNN